MPTIDVVVDDAGWNKLAVELRRRPVTVETRSAILRNRQNASNNRSPSPHGPLPSLNLHRRRFLLSGLGGALASAALRVGTATAVAPDDDVVSSRSHGLLLGSLIGDALGVPIEFRPTGDLTGVMPDARNWGNDQTLTGDRKRQLADSLRILPTAPYRPEAEPFGVWSHDPAPGSLSDDSRMKIVLMRAIAQANAANRALRPEDIARQFLRFTPHDGQTVDDSLTPLIQENLSEYRMASKALIESHNPEHQRSEPITPGSRIWGGVDNCSGQMMFPPLAILDAGDPEAAYRRCYKMNFIDTPAAKDIIAAINAGLSAVLTEDVVAQPARDRWKTLLATMRSTDPFGYGDVPFVGRRLAHWMDLAESIARRSAGHPATAYKLLETEGKPVFFWDAHFTLIVPITMLHLCDFSPLAAMHLCLDFGHDTDSYAQLLGAMIGAVHGPEIFNQEMTQLVTTRLAEDHGESIDAWMTVLDDSKANGV